MCFILLVNDICETGFATFQFLSYVFVNPIFKGSTPPIVNAGCILCLSGTFLHNTDFDFSFSGNVIGNPFTPVCVIMVQSLLTRI